MPGDASTPCLIWGMGSVTRYGDRTFYSYCDVQWPWGAQDFWCRHNLLPTADKDDPRKDGAKQDADGKAADAADGKSRKRAGFDELSA